MDRTGPPIGRRELLGTAASGLAAALASRWLAPSIARAEPTSAPRGRDGACIVLWLNGGPSHIDTFDPKPGRPTARFKALKTRARGLELSEHLPALAERADRLAVVRSLTTREGNHERARYLMHTGYAPNPTVRHPALGAWLSRELGAADPELPNFVSLGGPSLGPGFFGLEHGPFIVRDPSSPPENTTLAKGVDEARFRARRATWGALEADFRTHANDPQLKGRAAVYDQAARLMSSPKLSAFEPSDEPEAVRRAYGDTKFGHGCLVARRLIERGVKLVEVVLDGWDTHQDNFERTKTLMRTLDPAFAALLHDLDARGLASSTLVVCMGEFGRTPRINAREGRDHHTAAFSAVLSGAGIRGGRVFGRTDAEGAKVVEDPVTVADLFATIAQQMGLAPGKTVLAPSGRPIALTENGTPIAALTAG